MPGTQVSVKGCDSGGQIKRAPDLGGCHLGEGFGIWAGVSKVESTLERRLRLSSREVTTKSEGGRRCDGGGGRKPRQRRRLQLPLPMGSGKVLAPAETLAS